MEYLTIGRKMDGFMELFRCATEEAKDNFELENHTSMTIQRVFRGTRSRERISKMNYAATEVQRVFRGLLGRKKTKNQLRSKADSRQLSLYFYLCIQIQKTFRAYYSRKYKHDQARRKSDIISLQVRNEQIRREIDFFARDQAEKQELSQLQRKEDEFRSLAQNLHHLVSTKHIRGVYNPSAEHLQVPHMNDVPVEDHVRGAVRDLLRTKGISKTGLIADIHGSRKIPLKGLKYRLSIQASVPYDTLEKERRKETALHRILTAGKGNFTAGGTTAIINQTPVPLSVGDPFMDSWANPLMVKGVPKDQKQLMESSYHHKALFAGPVERPFVSRVGGNKSTTLANDLFDVIAEAEETGGAVQRQLGTSTTRFGLPASVDNRLDGTIPMPPVRTSCTVKSTRSKIRNVTVNVKAHTVGGSIVSLQQGSTAFKRPSFAEETEDLPFSDEATQHQYSSSDEEC